MSPAARLDQRSQARRGRLFLIGVVAAVAVLAVVALVADDDRPAQRTASEDATSTSTSTVPTSGEPSPTSTTVGVEPSTSEPSTSTPAVEPECQPGEVIGSWPLRRRLAQMVMVGVDPSGTGEATAAVRDHQVGGLFIPGNPTGLMTSGALDTLRAEAPLGLMVSVDEEGGRVQRIEGIDGDVPSARRMAATMSTDDVRALAQRRGGVMRGLGIDVDLAPVVDVSDQGDRTVIGDRSWSDDPATVVAYAGAYADGLLDAGVAPVLKHFPGHGQASGDTHEGSATTPHLDDLRERDLVPYADLLPRLGTRAGVMLGHLEVPGLTEDGLPTSLSPATVDLLRGEYGFDGVVMTDDMSGMRSVTDRFGPGEAAVRAVVAGVDVVLFVGSAVTPILDALEGAVVDGTVSTTEVDASVARILTFKGVDPCTVPG